MISEDKMCFSLVGINDNLSFICDKKNYSITEDGKGIVGRESFHFPFVSLFSNQYDGLLIANHVQTIKVKIGMHDIRIKDAMELNKAIENCDIRKQFDSVLIDAFYMNPENLYLCAYAMTIFDTHKEFNSIGLMLLMNPTVEFLKKIKP